MNKLMVRNIGPIKNGYADGFIEINKLTVFLGPQGSGKSTVAKIYSSLSWLEKVILRDEITLEECKQEGFFIDKVISYQGIQSYFNKDSFIHFIGKACEFKYQQGKFIANKINEHDNFLMPKIMYVPAERNFITAVSKPEFIKGLPKPLYSFLAEYEQAKQWVEQQQEVLLPIGNLAYQFDAESNKSLLVGNEFKIDLLHGSSGFQSLVPLFLVTEYLANLVLNKKDDPTYELFSVVQRKNIEQKLFNLIDEYIEQPSSYKAVANYPEFFKKKAKEITEYYKYKSFINIVEEPEQNLYPESQKQVLFSLIGSLNKLESNQLIITSHSPYILNYITLCTEAYRLYLTQKQGLAPEAIETLVPKNSSISISSVNAYQLDNNGNINLINKDQGHLDDSHSLNTAFEQINDDFSSLLDME